MNCDEVKRLIQLYLDDELDARSTLNVQQHLESCPACSNSFNSFIEQDRRLRQAANEETIDSSRLREKVLASIANQTPRHRFSPRRLKLPTVRRAAAALAILLVSALLLFRGSLFPHVDQQVYAAAASDHLKCTTGMRMGEITDSQELNQLAARFGKMKRLPDLTAFGYGQPHSTICKIQEEEFLHLVFTNPEQQPISVYLRPHTSDLIGKTPAALKVDSYHISSMSEAGVDLLVVGSLDEAGTSAIAQAIAQQIAR